MLQQKKNIAWYFPISRLHSHNKLPETCLSGNTHTAARGRGKGTMLQKFPTTVIAPSMYIPACVVYTIFFLSPSKIQTEGNLLLQCLGSQRRKKAAPLSAECSHDGWVYDSTLPLLSLWETQTQNSAVCACVWVCVYVRVCVRECSLVV